LQERQSGLAFDGLLVDASLQYEAKTTARGVRSEE